MVKFSNIFGKILWCTFTQILNEKKYKSLIFKVIKIWVPSKYTAQKTFTLEHGAEKNNVLKRPTDIIGINKVPIVG